MQVIRVWGSEILHLLLDKYSRICAQVCDIKHRFVVSDFVDTTFACLVVAKKCRHYN